MKARTFVLTGLTAVAMSAAAVIAYAWHQPFTQVPTGGAKLVPALAAATARIGSIVVSHGGKSLTLEAAGERSETWTIKEAGGFAAEPDRVRALLVKLAQAEMVEAKTRLPDRFALLEVEDPGPEAKSRSLRVIDPRGSMVADLIIGKRRFEAFGSGRSGSYVRRPGETQSWLATFDADLSTEIRSWVKPAIVELDSTKIDTVRIERGGEEPLALARVEGKATFTAFPPEGRKLKDATAAETLLRAVAQIDLDDVRKAEMDKAGEPTVSAVVKTSDGVTRTLRLRPDGEARWLSIRAAGEGEAKAAADAINQRLGSFEFRIAPAKADAIFKTRGDLLEPEKAG